MRDRLIVADGWWGSLDWTYDKTGNRLTETRDGVVSTYSYEPGTSRLLTVTGGTAHVLAYDPLGNATRYDDLCLGHDPGPGRRCDEPGRDHGGPDTSRKPR